MSTFTASESQPDMTRYDRWNEFWNVWSRTLPLDVEEWQYVEATAQAFDEFEKQDASTQAAMISKAWGIVKTLPKRRRKSSPAKVVVAPPPPRWEPCPFWRGEPCLKHKHTSDTKLQQAQSLFEIHSKFVRRRILFELAPLGKRGYDALEIESAVWWAVATRMVEYVPLLKTLPDDGIGKWSTDSETKDQARAQMWLRKIVHTTVIDVVRGRHAKKRDIDREVPIPEYAADTGIPNPAGDGVFGLPAKPTPTAHIKNGLKEVEDFGS